MRRRARQIVAWIGFAFVTFALVVGARVGVAADRGQCGHVHDSAQSSAVALGRVQSSGAFPRVFGYRGESGPGGELVGRSDQCGITDGGQDFGAEPEAHAGHAGDHFGCGMAAKSVLDVGIGGFDAVIEGNHLPGQLRDEPGGDFFSRQAHRLRFGGRHRCGCDRGGIAYPGVGQGQPRNTALANGFRSLVTLQQHHPAAVLRQLRGPSKADRPPRVVGAAG